MSLRDKLRTSTLGAKTPFKKEIIEYDGNEYEIRQPTIRDRSELIDKCSKIDMMGNSKIDNMEFALWCVIRNTYVPNTNERVFDDQDYDVLSKMPTHCFVDHFSDVATRMLNVEIDKKKSSQNQTKTS